jgi:methylated-DNA-[protein]-cysteine S-methyltransferase
MMLSVETIATPIGPVHLAVENGALQALRFDLPYEGIPERTAAGERVRAYFGGDLRAFDGLALEPRGTPFQQRVWTLLRDIPAGETRTYGQLAATLGTHPRAVGSANARNPVGIAIPCHRVVAADGTLCGYAWGEPRKRWLLAHERGSLG